MIVLTALVKTRAPVTTAYIKIKGVLLEAPSAFNKMTTIQSKINKVICLQPSARNLNLKR